MNETSKCHAARIENGDFARYLRGKGLDIGAGRDPLRPLAGEVFPFDVGNGDAQLLRDLPDNHFDFVYSSHCLEHMRSVEEALAHWIRVTKPGGYLYIVVPDFALYEKLRWPSCFNPDHKFSFSLDLTRRAVGRGNHYHLDDLRKSLWERKAYLIASRLEDQRYDCTKPHLDQTLGDALSQICFIAVKGS
jgi:SAM-dependent methyltransferase